MTAGNGGHANRIRRVRCGRLPSGNTAVLVGDDANGRSHRDELDPFLERLLGLFANRRHVFAGTPIDDRHVRAHAQRRARGIDRGIAAADDGDLLADLRFVTDRPLVEKCQRRIHAVGVLAGHAERLLLARAQREEYGVVGLGQRVERELFAERGVELELHARTADERDFLVYDRLWQAVLRQRVVEQTAGVRSFFAHRDRVAQQREVKRRGQPGGPAPITATV